MKKEAPESYTEGNVMKVETVVNNGMRKKKLAAATFEEPCRKMCPSRHTPFLGLPTILNPEEESCFLKLVDRG